MFATSVVYMCAVCGLFIVYGWCNSVTHVLLAWCMFGIVWCVCGACVMCGICLLCVSCFLILNIIYCQIFSIQHPELIPTGALLNANNPLSPLPHSPSSLSFFSVFKSLLWFASFPLCNFSPPPLPHGQVPQDPPMTENLWYLSLPNLFHNTLQFHPHCCKWPNFILSHCQVVFHCMYKPHLYPFIS